MEGLIAEAHRDKRMAEAEFKKQSFLVAEYYAVNAQYWYHELDGIAELVEALKVIVSAERKTDEEEVNRYKVLGVDPNADYDTIRRSYKKLAYAIHPDRNKSVAALTASKILSEAWSLLSNKEARALYDERRKQKEKFETVVLNKPSEVGGSQTGFPNVLKGNDSNQKAHGSATPSQPPPVPSFPATHTFWTRCSVCNVEFEYYRKYLNKNLRCVGCDRHFLAAEIPMPSPLADGNAVPYPFQQQNYGQHNNFGPQVSGWQPAPAANVGQADFSGLGSTGNMYQDGLFTNVGATMGPTAFTHSQPSVGTMQTAADAVTNRWDWKRKYGTKGPDSNARGSSGAGRVPKGDAPQKRKRQATDQKKPTPKRARNVAISAVPVSDSETESDSPVPLTNLKKAARKGAGNVASSVADVTESSKLLADRKRASMAGDINVGFCMIAMPELPMQVIDERKASLKDAGNEVFSVENVSEMLGKATDRKKATWSQTKKVTFAEGTLFGSRRHLAYRRWSNVRGRASYCRLSKELPLQEKRHLASKTKKMISMKLAENRVAKVANAMRAQLESNVEEAAKPVVMSVPDPDFYDFDQHRTVSAFDINQAWAAYDQEDEMPRLNAQIHYVVSQDPFHMIISWLTPNPNNDMLPADWTASGFAKTCGDFRVERSESNGDLNSFSHEVLWKRDPKGNIHICPGKGEVWALYKNWSPNWNASTPNEVVQEYCLVEVFRSFKKKRGVRVLPLVKVPGFRSVFRRIRGRSLITTIPKEEMNRFSHHVPAHRLTGNEAPNAPKSFWEVDPAACPLELLQVIPVEEPSQEGTEKAKKPEEQPVEEHDKAMAETSKNMNKGDELKVYNRRR